MEFGRDAEQKLLGRAVESVLTAFDRRPLKGRRLLVTGAEGAWARSWPANWPRARRRH